MTEGNYARTLEEPYYFDCSRGLDASGQMEAYLSDMEFFCDGITDELKGNVSLSKWSTLF